MLEEGTGGDTERSTVALTRDTEAVCRICYEGSLKDNKLISPCKCTGSLKFVHEECLKAWVLARNSEISNIVCELCKTYIKMQLVVKLTCKFKVEKHSHLRRAFHYFAIIVLLAGLTLATWALVIDYDEDDGARRGGMIVALIVTTFLMMLLLFALVSSILADSKCVHQMKDWRILERVADSRQHTRPTEESRVPTHEDIIEQSVVDQNEFMILPEFTRVRGRSVEVPQLSPLLARVRSASEAVLVYVAHPNRRESLASSFTSM